MEHPLKAGTTISATITLCGRVRRVAGTIVLRSPGKLVLTRRRDGTPEERIVSTGEPATMYPSGDYLVDIGSGQIVRINRIEIDEE